MSLRSLLDGLPEIRGGLSADARGHVEESTSPDLGERSAAATAAAVGELGAAGGAVGLARLEMVLVKGPNSSSVTAIRPDEFVLVMVDPARGTAHVEKTLHAWAAGDTGAVAPAVARPAAAPPPLPAPAVAARSAAASSDPWRGLRHALMRGLLTEAAARRRELAAEMSAAPRAGAEPVGAPEVDGAMQVLLHGIGSVLAGDGIGGARTLEPLAAESQRNLSFRWLALYWSGRAGLRSGNSSAARTHLKAALALAKQIDLEALSVTQWVAADVLAHDRDHKGALAFLAHARAGFERLGDRWGLAQTWLAEARVLAALEREQEATSAARNAWAADPGWEEPGVFLARRALARNDLAEAEEILGSGVEGPSGARVRSLIEAMRKNVVTPADAAEFLRESDAPPTARSICALERIAGAAPRFVQAREALAWMLLKVGKYAEASTLFRGLLAQQLTQADRASVMLGLGCIAHAQQAGRDPDARLQAAVSAGGAAAASKAGSSVAPLPPVSSSSLPARSSQIASTGSVFSGQLSVFALADVIEFVRCARRTGMLVCSCAKGMAAVRFRDGWITGATAPGTPDVGEILLRARKISTVALRAVRTSQPANQPDHLLAEQLVREGLVDAAAVQEALRRQVVMTVTDLVQWKDGEFAFNREAEGDPASSPLPVELDAQDVLLNVFKQLDEDARDRSAQGAQR